MIKRIMYCFVLLCMIHPLLEAQDLSMYEKHWMVQNGDTMPYRVLLPENYDPAKQYPLVLFLHGRGESGTNNESQLIHGSKLFLQDSIRKNYPAIVVFPQCSKNSYWSNVLHILDDAKTGKRNFHFIKDGEPTQAMKLLMGLTGYLLERYPVKKQQVYVMGLSMGGMGTFELVRRMPNVFAAAIPICGGADPATAKALTKTRWWIFHGGKDDVVLPIYSERMVTALQQQKAKVQFKLFPNANHNSWDATFAEPGLLRWMWGGR